MFGFTSTARLRQELAVRDARIAKLMQERDDARSERDAFKAAAEITELRASAAYRGERLIEGGRFRRMTASDEVQQLRAQARELDKRLRELTEINQRCTCGGGAS
ncbi:hypothetical protein GCM10009601_51180 [Streptomyces thermospinosisporus]|uniref:Uncharacterized protein n=1 Tax=Streptomyces thermospinosisporus TaxID=161482 RepID=A0ABP4JXM9_9ACTN